MMVVGSVVGCTLNVVFLASRNHWSIGLLTWLMRRYLVWLFQWI